MTDFSSLPLPPDLLRAVAAADYATMTPVQAQALPPMLEGRDVVAQARTGSGKTAAFALALLARLDLSVVAPQALVLCPTRELADQVSREIRRLGAFLLNLKLSTFCGGIPLRPHLASLAHPPHVVVGTPGRVQELVDHGALALDGVRCLVLDEADRMLDMGFLEAIEGLVVTMPRERQTLLFSATIPESIRTVSARLQRDPASVTLDEGETSADVEQRFHEVDARRRFDALERVLGAERPESALVFCNTRRDVQDLADGLVAKGFSALALHGDLDQRDRDETLVRFANRSCSVLVATDVAARGLDIDDLPLVVNWEVSTDPDVHVHRIGRTGRAGRQGVAVSLVAPAEMPRMAAIESRTGTRVRWTPLPVSTGGPLVASMATLRIDGGRQDKLRPGDILGALTGDAGVDGKAVGKIAVFPTRSYVAIRTDLAATALKRLRAGRIKARTFRVQPL
ncbi:ATP-dependent RNA helicase DbpA [Dokdonella sp. MW10]|uniref:ATP-dependent RNA helicase DbpA n=1 Tax=Dokdonella sp. MW10 TaxID=2992926 RepID=UPI003F7F9B3D